MLSANKIKLIQSLDKKKYRQKYNLFVVEGIKNIKEFIFSDFSIKNIYSTENISFLDQKQYEIISNEDLKKISFLKTPNNALAIIEIPQIEIKNTKSLQLVLDDIQDPGNLGTIIRLADWFGIEQILCSIETVNVYNPKVIQSTMGSLARVNIVYTDLEDILKDVDIPVYATDMNGDNIYTSPLPEEALIVMGNEGNGISDKISSLCTGTLTIPRFGNNKKTESLNVAMAASIVLSEFFSRKIKNGQ